MTIVRDAKTACFSFLRGAKSRLLPVLKNRMITSRFVPVRARAKLLSTVGVSIGRATVGKNVRFLNSNVSIADGVEIGDGCTFAGLGRIQLGRGVILDKMVTIDTALNDEAAAMVIHRPIYVPEAVEIPYGSIVRPGADLSAVKGPDVD